jgi:predicted nucleic acid-binding protein
MIFLDTNVLLELILPGRSRIKEVEKLIADYPEVVISTLSIHLCWHFGRQAGVSDELIAAFVGTCQLVSLDPQDYYWAQNNQQGKDFEDALQIACSIRNACSPFFTMDRRLMKRYASFTEFITV